MNLCSVKDIVEAVLSEDGGKMMERDRVRYMISQDKMTDLLRNKIIVAAAVRRLNDEAAGQIISAMLELSGDGQVSGTAVSYGDIEKVVRRLQGEEGDAVRYLDQYLRILADDKTRFLHKVGEEGGGK